MPPEVTLPRLGQGMESGTIVRWLKSEGEAVQKGEPLFELDTDKVTQDVEAEADGVLLKIAVAGGEVPGGQAGAFLGAGGGGGPDVAGGGAVRADVRFHGRRGGGVAGRGGGGHFRYQLPFVRRERAGRRKAGTCYQSLAVRQRPGQGVAARATSGSGAGVELGDVRGT